MRSFSIIFISSAFIVAAYFLFKEGCDERTPGRKMLRKMNPQSFGGRRYHSSYSIIYSVLFFLAALYLLSLLFS